tara:strand:- start:1 stop:456 length:456 start_codon:yes stop_codon:yes gene_type:complete
MDKLNKIDILPKWWSIVIWIIIAVVVIFTPLKGQDLLTKNDYPDYTYDDYKYQIGAFQVRPEVVPYSMVLSEAVGYGCWLEIEIIEPLSIQHMESWEREEIKELLIKRAAFEEINPTERNGIFTIDSKAYYMVKIPSQVWGPDWEVFRRVK